MLFHLPLALLLAGTPELDAARLELDACASRIEALKAERRRTEVAHRELERLLVRAQELAASLERARARAELPLLPLAPSAEELRERADAARDQADRLAAEIAGLDVRIADARWRPHSSIAPRVSPAAFGVRALRPADVAESERVEELLLRRAALAEERVLAERAAAAFDAEARAAEAAR